MKKYNKIQVRIFFFVLSLILNFICLLLTDIYPLQIAKHSVVYCLVMILISIITFSLFLDICYLMLEFAHLKSSNEVLQQHIRMRQEYLTVQEDTSQKLEKLKDYFYAKTTALLESPNENGQMDAREIASEIIKEYVTIYETHFCQNETIDAIMYNKFTIASSLHIPMKHTLLIPQDLSLSSVELISLYINLLDYAIEQSQLVEESQRNIEISSFIKHNYLVINLNFNKANTTHINMKKLNTSLTIVKHTCEKNKGMLSFEETASTLSLHATCFCKVATKA